MTWPSYSEECRREINEILEAGGTLSAYRANPSFGLGPKEGSQVWKFEREIERKFRVRHAVACSSGTAALHMGVRCVVREGDEVVTSPYTFSATVAAILLAGGRPVFADVDPHNFCITKETVKRVLTKKTKLILPVHLFGYYQDLSDLASLGVHILEDACQAVGASRDGRYAGTHQSIAGCYSFNGTKNIPAGEGGCLVTNDDKVAERARLYLNHQENYGEEKVGVNYRMHELVACLARHGLRDLEKRNATRSSLAAEFKEILSEAGWGHRIPYGVGKYHAFYVTPFLEASDRPKMIERLNASKVSASAGYITPPLHHYRAFRKYAKRPLEVVDDLSFRSLCIISSFTPDKDITHAIDAGSVVVDALNQEALR